MSNPPTYVLLSIPDVADRSGPGLVPEAVADDMAVAHEMGQYVFLLYHMYIRCLLVTRCRFKCTIQVGYGQTLLNRGTLNADAHCSFPYVTLDERDTMDPSHCLLLPGISRMVGDTTNAIWNESEWISFIIRFQS